MKKISDVKVGDIVNGKTILWMDNPSELIHDILIKVGEFNEIMEYKDKCFNCGTTHVSPSKKYINIKFIRLSEL